MFVKNKSLINWLTLLGLAGVIFCFLHVFIGKINYPDYDFLRQAVSDLTAADAPSREIASSLSTVYAIFTAAGCLILSIFFHDKETKLFRLGIYLFTIMQWLSAVGYTLFPLTSSGYAGEFQDIMHMVVTVLVVLLSIVSMILISIACMREKKHELLGIITIVSLSLMFLGSIGTGIVPENYFGIPERISVYSVVIYTGFLSLFAFTFKVAND
ncbi:MAG: DUF998 domain-containing protein [Acholeplasmatales bacterium]